MRKENNNKLKLIVLKASYQVLFIIFLSGLIGLGSNLYRKDALPLLKDWSSNSVLDNNGKDIRISLQQAEKHYINNTALFFDARDKASYDEGHIKGAKNVPLSDIDNLFIDIAKTVQQESLIITYCDGETCNLSHELALFLKEMGFKNVRILVNGWTLWQKAQLPAETSN